MPKKITLKVELSFNDPIKDKGLVVAAVRDALKSWVDNSESGLGADDTFTTGIKVSARFRGPAANPQTCTSEWFYPTPKTQR
jgi:hypothetical protein